MKQSGFHTKGEEVWYYHYYIPMAHAPTFQVINGNYAKDRAQVYWAAEPMVGVTPDHFRALSPCYAVDDQRVYAGSTVLATAEVHSFQLLNDPHNLSGNYAIDRARVYYHEALLPGVNPHEFELLSPAYGKDKHHVYQGSERIPQAQAATFKLLNERFAADARHIYYLSYPARVLCANDGTFEDLGEGYYRHQTGYGFVNNTAVLEEAMYDYTCLDGPWYRIHQTVYYYGLPVHHGIPTTFLSKGSDYALIDGTLYYEDIALGFVKETDFQVYDPALIQIGNTVYYCGEPMTKQLQGSLKMLDEEHYHDHQWLYQLQPKWGTFQKLARDVDSFELLDDYYSKDKHHVYFASRKIEVADPATFKTLGQYYSVDHQHGYYQDQVLKDLIPAEASLVGDQCLKDRHTFYWHATKLLLDPHTTKYLDRYHLYLADQQYVYYQDRLITEADTLTFEVLRGPYAKDQHHVYYQGTCLKDITPHIVAVSESMIKDRHVVYRYNKQMPEAEAASFQDLTAGFYKDRHAVYYGDQVMPCLDAATFQVIHFGLFSDQNGYYEFHQGTIVKKESIA